MIKNPSFVNWFKKVIAVFIEIFFIGAIFSTLYVFTYPFSEDIKLYIFIAFVIVFGIVVYFLRNKVRDLLALILTKLEKLNTKSMLIIIVLTMIILKVIFTIFFYFDPTTDGDIQIYVNIANKLYDTGHVYAYEIKHLFGTALHLLLFKSVNIQLHIGIFIAVLIGTVVNFFTFKDIVGKEKSFLLIMFYILMPSTILLTYCPTHELFAYLYYSLFLFSLNRLIASTKKKDIIIYSILLVFSLFMACFVNPSGILLYVVIGLIVVLSNTEKLKKILLTVILIICIALSELVPMAIGLRDEMTTANDYTVLICGASIDTRGEHVDRYPQNKAIQYMKDNNLNLDYDGYLVALKAVLFDEYKYLLTHPIDFISLLAHKFYIEWSGDHYSLEMAHDYQGINDILYYLFLGLSALIYLFVITAGLVLYKKKDDDLYISNCKLMVLGLMALLLISLVLNKYSVYVTIFIYLIAFYRIDFTKE